MASERWSRRRFLGAAAATSLTACAPARVRFSADPFSLGVASGYPRPAGIVLWTRLAPVPLAGGGMDPVDVPVRWEVADDERFARVLKRGVAVASPAAAHAVHVEVDGLEPSRGYFYRFIAGGETSPTGRLRTAPAPGSEERLRLAVASCQQYEQGFFVAHRHLAAEEVDLVAFVGDYIYESSWGREHVRKHGTPEPRTLEDYRNRYALYKSDADLQSSHLARPWIVTWDDHEVDNDYANDRSEDLDPAFLARRAAAYQAFREHHPLPSSMRLHGSSLRIHDRLDWGSLARVHILDDRQYRSHQACPRPRRGGGNRVGDDCTERIQPQRTMLGAAQERWLEEGLASSRARWNLLAQQTQFAPAPRSTSGGPLWWTDGWDGYPAARERLIRSLVQSRAANPVILGGDVHQQYAADVHEQPRRVDSPVVASEFVTTSITSQGGTNAFVRNVLEVNPHIRYGEAETRGYTVLDIGRERLEARHRGVQTVKRPDAAISTLATLTVEAGRPGVRK